MKAASAGFSANNPFAAAATSDLVSPPQHQGAGNDWDAFFQK
jgi:hypothetical protein